MSNQLRGTELLNSKIADALENFSASVEGVLSVKPVTFQENLALIDGCNPYGCKCISHEKCCGCLLQ